MSKVVIPQSQKKQVRVTFFGVIMVAASIFVFIQDNIPYKIIGMVGILFFGLCLSIIIYRLIIHKGILIIDENGFVDNSSLQNFGFVQWEYVESLRVSSKLNYKFISVKMKASYNPNISRMVKILSKINTPFTGEMINISLDSTDANINDVLLMMQEHLIAYRSN